jgi:DNA-binding transcriptional LysR family regulator
MAQHLVPAACSRLLALVPEVTLDITAGTGRGLLPLLVDGHLDLLLSGLPPGEEPGLRHELVMEDEVVVIARRDHALHRRRTVTLADLSGQRWILSKSGSLLADWLDHRWRDAGMPMPVPAVQTDSMATLLSIVAATDLVTFHSWSTIRRSPLHAALRPLRRSPLTWRRKLGVTYREGGYLASAARQLIGILVEMGTSEGR